MSTNINGIEVRLVGTTAPTVEVIEVDAGNKFTTDMVFEGREHLNLEEHPVARGHNNEQKMMVKKMFHAGAEALECLLLIKKKDPNNVSTLKTIYSVWSSICKEVAMKRKLCEPKLTLLKEPLVPKKRGMPKGLSKKQSKASTTSTKQDLLGFEYVEGKKRKLLEVGDPKSTLMEKPLVTKKRGRPKGSSKKESKVLTTSTKQDQLGFEFVESQKRKLHEIGDPNSTLLKEPLVPKRKGRPKGSSKNGIGYPKSTLMKEPLVPKKRGRPKGSSKKESKASMKSTKHDPSGFVSAESKKQRKLHEIGDLKCTLEKEPLMPKRKGRSKGSTKNELKASMTSTKRDPSGFEYVESKGYKSRTFSVPKSIKRNRDRRLLSADIINCLPKAISHFIKQAKDVAHDGHCGFRAVADLLGMGDDGWRSVRGHLVKELENHKEQYTNLFGSEQRVCALSTKLKCWNIPAAFEFWMTMPDMGLLISSWYNVVLVHISNEQCLTFLPLRSPFVNNHRLITIGYINKNHFVELNMSGSTPVPPISRNWWAYHDEVASGWAAPYMSRTKSMIGVIEPKNSIHEVILDLD